MSKPRPIIQSFLLFSVISIQLFSIVNSNPISINNENRNIIDYNYLDDDYVKNDEYGSSNRNYTAQSYSLYGINILNKPSLNKTTTSTTRSRLYSRSSRTSSQSSSTIDNHHLDDHTTRMIATITTTNGKSHHPITTKDPHAGHGNTNSNQHIITTKDPHAGHGNTNSNQHAITTKNNHVGHSITITNENHDGHSTQSNHDNSGHGDHSHSNNDGHGSGEHGSGEHGSGEHGSGEHGSGGHGSGEHEGGHHVPPPSYQLQKHEYSYKPEGFSMYTKEVGIKKTIVGFKYGAVNHYDRYVIRVRFHGYPEFATAKMKVNRTGSNELLLNKFLDAQYIICVTLFSSSGLPDYPPISTSDMCIDILVGEAHVPGGHHSTSGLLSPLLLAVAAVLLAYIIIGTKIKEKYKEHHEKKVVEEKVKRMSICSEEQKASMEKAEQIEKLDTLLHRPSVVQAKWHAAAYRSQIVENQSYDDFNTAYYTNPNIAAIEYEKEAMRSRRESRVSSIGNRRLTSLETLSHLLDNKPWISRV